MIGYARVSTPDQNLPLQRDALKKAGCKKVFTDVASGAKSERPGLTRALESARRGDTIVVWKLDRFGRSLVHLLESVRALQARRVGFKSLQESIDTTSSSGKLVFHVFGALAEFERDIVRERTMVGLTAARARGRKGGRPRVLDEKGSALARSLYNDKNNSPADICRTLGISRASLYRYLSPAKPTMVASEGPPPLALSARGATPVAKKPTKRRGKKTLKPTTDQRPARTS
jgi:DNA invertase Pin-like site-specific DNA recombinase